MRALSLWQPHASFMANGDKAVETRNRATKVRGEVAICSARRAFPFLTADVVNLWHERLGKDPLPAGSRAMTDGSLVVMAKHWDSENGHEEICCVRPKEDMQYGPQDERDKANAALIAAAPDLLSACEALLREFVPSRDAFGSTAQGRAFDAAKAAIAKATL